MSHVVVHIVTTGLQNVRNGKEVTIKALSNTDSYKHNIAWVTLTVSHIKHMPVAILATYSPHVVECVLRHFM
jgi:hypothetical protein